MTKKINVYQFKITLDGIKPAIWRRIQVPETYSFWDLHVAIQDSMGWLDCHLHEFEVIDPKTGATERFGIPDETWGEGPGAGWKYSISDYFSSGNKKATYLYDFGDGWEHKILFEKTLPASEEKYPICLAGERACPPEDCGGTWGYEELIEIMKNPKHEEYENMKEWLSDEFNPENFDPKEVCFEDPNKRFKQAIQLAGE